MKTPLQNGFIIKMSILPTWPRKRTSQKRCFIVSSLEGTRGNVHLSSTFYQLFLGRKDLVNNYPCNHFEFVSSLNQAHSMQSCDPLSLCINKKPSSNNSSIELMPLIKKRVMKKRVHPPRIADQERPKYPHPITTKGGTHVYINFE